MPEAPRNAEPQPTPFIGNFPHKLDAKNRITIPAKWRVDENATFCCLPDPANQFLIVMPPDELQRLRRKTENDSNLSGTQQRKMIRYLFTQSQDCAADRQGRVLLPAEQCRQVGLTTDVVLAGGDNRFEIWPAERWQRSFDEDLAIVREVAAQIGL